MPQAFRPRQANAAVAVTLGRDRVLALGLDARQLELLAQDVRQLFQRDFDLENVVAGLRPAAAGELHADCGLKQRTLNRRASAARPSCCVFERFRETLPPFWKSIRPSFICQSRAHVASDGLRHPWRGDAT